MRRFVHPANQTFARKSWKTRWFVLAGSVIKYYKEEVHFLAGGAKPLGMLQLDSDTVFKVSIGTFSYRIFYISAGMWYSRKRVKMPPCSQANLVLTFSLSLCINCPLALFTLTLLTPRTCVTAGRRERPPGLFNRHYKKNDGISGRVSRNSRGVAGSVALSHQ